MQVVLADGVDLADVDHDIRAVVEAELDRMPEFQSELMHGAYAVC